jgi:hypothetical protein
MKAEQGMIMLYNPPTRKYSQNVLMHAQSNPTQGQDAHHGLLPEGSARIRDGLLGSSSLLRPFLEE